MVNRQIPTGLSEIEDFVVSGNASSFQVDEIGRVVLAGVLTQNRIERSVIIRLDSTGQLDRSFGQGGIVSLPESFSAPAGMDISSPNPGYYVLSGAPEFPAIQAIQVARLFESGEFFRGFGQNGVATIRQNAASLFGSAIKLVQPGLLLAAGMNDGAAFVDTLDEAGRTVLQTTPDIDDPTLHIFNIETAGAKYLLMWRSFGFGYLQGYRLTKHNLNGSLDLQFGANGYVLGVDFGTPESYVTSGILRKNGMIAISGVAMSQPYILANTHPWGLGIAGYASHDGSPDLSWDPILGRTHHFERGADFWTFDMTELPDESLVMVGQRWDESSGIGVLALWKLKQVTP